MKIARAVLDRQAVRVGKLMGRDVYLDYAACYGGYKLVENITNNDLLGMGRMPAGDINRALSMVERALEIAKGR